ncbi:hypothetical protein QQP08_019623 [Theobroma cacao]|nr:hypothetical protein QQP08_019623 [Theobroma cacao]
MKEGKGAKCGEEGHILKIGTAQCPSFPDKPGTDLFGAEASSNEGKEREREKKNNKYPYSLSENSTPVTTANIVQRREGRKERKKKGWLRSANTAFFSLIVKQKRECLRFKAVAAIFQALLLKALQKG